MKIQVVSDLHFEFGVIPEKYDRMVNTPADVLVLAGDISTHDKICHDLVKIQKDANKPVVFVPGNHEHYHSRRSAMDREFRALNHKDLHVLIEGKTIIDGVMFLGSTGWWDGSGGNIGLTVKNAMNDFSLIFDIKENLDGIKWGREARLFFEQNLARLKRTKFDGKVVCVSHNFPHARSIARQYQGSVLNGCFCNRWEHVIREFQPDLWIHGHTHTGFDYKEGDTRIVCNPQGYLERYAMPREDIIKEAHRRGIDLLEADMRIFMTTENKHFDPSYIVEI
jgi:Icc-related predicted phosphoesterase